MAHPQKLQSTYFNILYEYCWWTAKWPLFS